MYFIMYRITTKDLIKYAVFLIIIYTLIKTLPKQELSQRDIILIIVVIGVGYYLIDCLGVKENFTDTTMTNTYTTANYNSTGAIVHSSQPVVSTSGDTYISGLSGTSTTQNMTQVSSIPPNTTTTQTYTYNSNPNVENIPVRDTRLTQEEIDNLRRIQDNLNTEIEKLERAKIMANTNENDHAYKYMTLLMKILEENKVLTQTDINNTKLKIQTKLLTVSDVIKSLEELMKANPQIQSTLDSLKNAYEASQLPTEMYHPLGTKELERWDNEFAILNTNKWSVPMPRPPVCINTNPCKVCPTNTSGYPVNLKEWHHSRRVMNTTEQRQLVDTLPTLINENNSNTIEPFMNYSK